MIDYETYVQIRNYYIKDGLRPSQIAEALSIDRRTVERNIHAKRYQQRKTTPRKSKLDPFKEDIIRMLEKHRYSARQIFQQIQETGFEGGVTIVEDYVRKVRPLKTKAFLKLVFMPGECAQVDWGSYGTVAVGSTTRRLSFFVMVLCHSRMMYVDFTVSQTMEHFLGCHQNAFRFFGYVPKKIMVDNLKSAVLKRIVGKSPVFNPRYFDFAEHYGFSIVPCNVGKGNEKGQVESGVGYVKKNLLNGLDISDFKVMKPVAQNWLDTIANVRIHGETGKKPLDMFLDEKPYLQPLPAEPYDIGVVKQMRASRQFRVSVDTNHYSVPAQLAGVGLTVKMYPDRLCIYHENKQVAQHIRSYDRRKDFEHPDHPKVLLAQRKKAKDQKIFMRFLSLSEKAQAYYQQLEQKRMNPAHHIRQIVALSEIYSKEKVAVALEDAFTFSAFSCDYIANLLEQRSRPNNEPGVLHLTRSSDLLDLTIEYPDLSIYDDTIGGDYE
jgi:transposase